MFNMLRLILVFSLLTCYSQAARVIYVRLDGSSSTNCWTGGDRLPCNSVSLAIAGLQTHPVDTTIVVQGTAEYPLPAGANTSVITGAKNVLITGGSAGVPVLYCNHTGSGGLAFVNSVNVTVSRLTVRGCGISLNRHPSQFPYLTAAITFVGCVNISVAELFVISSNSLGIFIWNNTANVIIAESTFNDSGQGGVMIILQSTDNINVKLTNCTFSNTQYTNVKQGHDNRSGRALFVMIKGTLINSSVLIDNSTFINNHNGGLYLQFNGAMIATSVTVSSSKFEFNKCGTQDSDTTDCEGGGVKMEFLTSTEEETVRNETMNTSILFTGCHFIGNHANVGGGLALVLSQGLSEANLKFLNCSFGRNTGTLGSAISAYTQAMATQFIIPCLRLHNSSFNANEVEINYGSADGLGAVYCDHVPLCLEGRNTFTSNTYTAVVLSVASLTISSTAQIEFTSNSGHNGGALALLDAAVMTIDNESVVEFRNNKARNNGGAIFVANYAYQDKFTSDSNCFLQYSRGSIINPDQWGVQFIFDGNLANDKKNSIYTPSLLPCVWNYPNTSSQESISHTFCWKGWQYSSHSCQEEIETAAATITTEQTTLRVFPGHLVTLPVDTYDDYHKKSKNSLLSVSLEQGSNASTDRYTLNKELTTYGEPETTHQLTIDTLLPRVLKTQINITFELCPPGFVLKGKEQLTCECGDDFQGTIVCDAYEFVSYLKWGFFLTYNESSKITVGGPWNIAAHSTNRSRKSSDPLPVNLLELNDYMCDNINRHGYLCAECVNGTSAPANSLEYICVTCSDDQVRYNWIFFIAQEIIPVTVFFIVIVLFNIRSTSGPACAFVFFAQMITNPITVSRYNKQLNHVFPNQEGIVKLLLIIFIVPYSIWNLDFFSVVVPPYCIAQDMKTIHSYALQYLMAFYPLVLIIVCFVCIELHAHNFRPLVWFWKPFGYCLGRWKRNWRVQTSMIDVFATFLNLSYTKFTSISIYLLIPLNVYRDNGTSVGPALVFPDMSVRYGYPEHIYFAIVAILVIIFIVILPPLFLILYQFKMFQKKIGKFRIINNSIVRTFVEAFQGTFKDGTNGTSDCRWFGSLYFIVRFLCFLLFLAAGDIIALRLYQTLLMLLFTLPFALFRPYKNDQHTNIDLFILTVLMIIIAIGFYNEATPNGSYVVNGFLMIATFVPLVLMTVLVLKSLLLKQRCCRPKKLYSLVSFVNTKRESTDDIEFFPDRMVHPGEYGSMNTIIAESPDLEKHVLISSKKKHLRQTVH